MNKELSKAGVKSTALAPGFVDTPMTDFIQEHVPKDTMIQTRDLAESVRFLLRLTPGCVVPEIIFEQPGGGPLGDLSV
jgi:NAD(P)-dependent dehydrogenase (short-subunit alcohol dehydrogenase family)